MLGSNSNSLILIPHLRFHAVLSILTVTVLAGAGVLALALAIQERLLRMKHVPPWMHCLPPIETMERQLFLVNRCGFLLLTVLLMVSFYFFHSLLWNESLLLSKTVLAMIAWTIFLVLLLGRSWYGWRGLKAIHATLLGVFLLIVIYSASVFKSTL
jgi:ABC-type uncharacterized transport system permease subunit